MARALLSKVGCALREENASSQKAGGLSNIRLLLAYLCRYGAMAIKLTGPDTGRLPVRSLSSLIGSAWDVIRRSMSNETTAAAPGLRMAAARLLPDGIACLAADAPAAGKMWLTRENVHGSS